MEVDTRLPNNSAFYDVSKIDIDPGLHIIKTEYIDPFIHNLNTDNLTTPSKVAFANAYQIVFELGDDDLAAPQVFELYRLNFGF